MKKALIPLALSVVLSACATTQSSTQTPAAAAKPDYQVQTPATMRDASGHPTLEQIMSDPQWIARSPQQPFVGADGQVYFWQQRESSELYDLMTVKAGKVAKVADQDRYQHVDGGVWQNGRHAYSYQGNLYLQQQGQVRQLTGTSDSDSDPQFLSDGRIAFQRGNAIYTVDPASGLVRMLASVELKKQPEKLKEAKGYLETEQKKLLQWVDKKYYQDPKAQLAEEDKLQAADPTANPEPFYLGEGRRLVELSLSKDGSKLVVVTENDTPERADKDIMPNYLGRSGEIEVRQVRQRVAEWKPNPQVFTVIDLKTRAKKDLALSDLPGIDKDPLAKVREENRKAGYQVEPFKGPRAVHLIEDWSGHQLPIQWSDDGKLALMLEAEDNKDRWLVTADLKTGGLTTQHHLHDDAWVNYQFNDFGWLKNDSLWYQSEESGYSHLYLKPWGGKAKQLTHGAWEVHDPVLSADEQSIYFKGNVKHPGIYEVYKLDLASDTQTALTDLNGMTDFVLSPDNKELVLTHSKVLSPPELYSLNTSGGTPKQLTHTVSKAFEDSPWIAPKIVAIPSSHTQQPIYAKIYLPKNFDPAKHYPAVVFNHGAGYLQEVDMGWSDYFREFMFNSMLASQGYVVMDMDYRASEGYGRDWRTAIYRQMGTPEVQDLKDGVNYMASKYGVDKSRVGTYGGSYGGFLTFMSLYTAPDLFKAGAALRPVADWANYNAPYTANILNLPGNDPIAYHRSSPIYFAKNLQSQLLIMSGILDDNVFFQDSVRMVQHLIELHKTNHFSVAPYPVEHHGFRQPSSWLDEYQRIYNLMQQNLK
ncbi:S9 family peptidase [Gallaecimonas pentaromativorans]|uniref:Dipeptidyl aminopeptidase/acylaminoacyl peptidase n=1 Tax=Gallaecimonas pentaromativorans TaxID=584787 RepID=A0A3N1PVE4_9GAMM|nr:prolyl oligopeptidase family serine peptidase [Gallaecimonas pentaromativorans]ROQ30737.1 dipeptidyl aminopeptidase/acylaminoacyl peptidase [Gallaecimonas pentaromativorans]